MACDPLQPGTCVPDLASAGVKAATSAAGDAFADSIRGGAAWVIRTTVGWWIEVPAIDLERSPVAAIRGYVLGIAVLVALAGVIWQGTMMAVSRKPEPVFAGGRGLFLLMLWTAVGVAGPAAALRAGDAFSSWVLTQAAGGQAADRLVALAGLANVSAPGAVMILGLVMMLVGLVQAILMMFREAALVILSGVVVLAAAGSMIGATRPWLSRIVSWMLALICYKPAAALVYASALTLVGDSTDVRTVFVGVTMMLLAIIALPTLLKVFTWTTGTVSGGGGGFAALAGASAAALHAGAAMTSRSASSARQHAETLGRDLGPGGSPSGGAGPGGGSPDGGGSPSGSGAGALLGAGLPAAAPVTPTPGTATSGAATSGAAASGSASGAAASGAGAAAAGAVAPWLLAAQKLAEGARAVKDAAVDAGDTMTPKDGS